MKQRHLIRGGGVGECLSLLVGRVRADVKAMQGNFSFLYANTNERVGLGAGAEQEPVRLSVLF